MENLPTIIPKKNLSKNEEKLERIIEEKKLNNRAFDVANAISFLLSATKEDGLFSEKIPLDSSGEVDSSTFMNNAGRTLLERSQTVDLSRGGVKKFIDEIQEKDKTLICSLFENNGYLIFEVKNKIHKGVAVRWVSQGVEQWTEPKKIKDISPDGTFAFFEGSDTGIPVNQLELVD